MQLSLTQDELNHIVRKAIERNNGAEHDVMRDTLVEYLISLFPDKDFTLDEAATVEKIIDLLIQFSVTSAARASVEVLDVLSQKALAAQTQ
ncbi:TPA: hypothetical protein ACX4DQ_002276 [Enterococcus faecalis]|uniref:hypothetical protein n=1 Tax=Enterococcus faecalis TaxID=1351 RepID=UPI001EE3E274|nr:hypothetical protein [Enterococcus faecalis]EHB5081921.1 hypothetical protein [Enterococcus faecalis]EKK5287623.1 hypothetical protein [Enterococcus faecalis]MDK7897381.1 hypothetical protein [Enterococcus faecalis]UKU96301.1 hypothetical protein L5I25_09700 [Enterococcus faecalis]UKU98996.1 hypothetical protein L5I23_09780 [Enterococcus faecalis]